MFLLLEIHTEFRFKVKEGPCSHEWALRRRELPTRERENVSRTRTAAVVASAFAAATVLVGAGSATGASIGATPIRATPVLVKQIGPRNYAGPNCPGKTWNCTSSTRVLQIATASGQNRAECGTGTLTEVGSTQTCIIEQEGPENSARCIERSTAPDALQICKITQTGNDNKAVVDQSIDTNDGSTQLSQQIATVDQDSATGDGSTSNDSTVTQDAKQMTKSGDVQKQDAFQSAVITQTAVGSGDNKSKVDQSQLQKAFDGTTQDQNSAFSLPSGFTDCATTSPFQPNACANVEQHSDSGSNSNHLKQSIDEDMNSHADANQQQGSFGGGLEGRVHQDTLTGHSTNDADQHKHQKMNGGNGSFQLQVDPVRCCGTFSQIGGTGNHEDIDQHASLDASELDANQQISLLGDSRSPDGSCSISQHAKINTDTTMNGASIDPCPILIVATECIQGFEEQDPGCIAFPPGSCRIECDNVPRLPFARARH